MKRSDRTFVEFSGASYEYKLDEKIWVNSGEKVFVNPDKISAFYDHTILTDGYKLRVFESLDEIKRKLEEV